MHEFQHPTSKYRMRYNDLPGKGTPILFIHGLGCAGSFDYPEVVSQPELSDYRRILIDLLGSGYSDKPTGFGYTVKDHAQFIADFVAQMGFDQIIMFGHSLGGAIALTLAHMMPDQVERIIISEANLDAGGGGTSRSIAAYAPQAFIDYGFREVIQLNLTEANDMWAASFSNCSPVAMHRISQSAVEGQTPSWREIFYKLKCPRTFIFSDSALPDDDEQILADHGINIEVVCDAGHSMSWENPCGLATAIRNGLTI